MEGGGKWCYYEGVKEAETMNFDDYQKTVAQFDVFAGSVPKVDEVGFMAKVAGLCEEAGEVAGKFKRIYREGKGNLRKGDKELVVKELGDVLWYTATIARYLGVDLSMVAEENVAKLSSRMKRGEIGGAGDDR